jgi:hypothetical protein
MQNTIWGRRTETGLTGQEFRDAVELHLTRHIGEPHTAFSDNEGWAEKSREPGPPVDVLVSPPEGERRFAYVTTFGCSMKKAGDSLSPGGKARLEFVMAAPQKGDPKADLATLNLAANTVRQFAKLVHLQSVRITPGETVQFAADPKPMFDGSRQVAFAFMRPRLPAEGFETMRLNDGELVRFIAPVPIFSAELQMGRGKGAPALSKALMLGGVTEMLDFARQPVARTSFLSKLKALFSRD